MKRVRHHIETIPSIVFLAAGGCGGSGSTVNTTAGGTGAGESISTTGFSRPSIFSVTNMNSETGPVRTGDWIKSQAQASDHHRAATMSASSC